jgi:flagellar hook protein FlgE
MSFYTALSGLNAAQTDISVTSNNIANVGTVGFRASRAEFADIFTNAPSSRPSAQIGIGTEVTRMGINFNQGAIRATGSVLDLSIQGSGFFQVQVGPEANAPLAYTRAGAFNMNNAGYIVNTAGQHLTGFPVSANGDTLTTAQTQPLRIPLTYGQPTATSQVDLRMRLSTSDNGGMGSQAALPAGAFDPANPETFAHSVAVPVLDANGQAVPAMAYFVLTDAPDAEDGSMSYEVRLVVNGQIAVQTAPAQALSFDAEGLQTGGLQPLNFTLPTGNIALNLAESSVGQGAFGVTSVRHDGQSTQRLSAIEVRDNGLVWARYGSETSIAVGQVAIANFTDLQGLASLGNASYSATRTAGPVRLDVPGSAGLGAIRSGAVEQANVDLTEQLVHLIMAQRNYQASAKALETNGKLSETIMNIRS